MIGATPTRFNLYGLAAVGLRLIEGCLVQLENPTSAELRQLGLIPPIGALLFALMDGRGTTDELESLRIHLDEMIADAAEVAERGRSVDDLLMPVAGHA